MPAVTVTKSFTFDAAHVLPWHTGKCSRLHGHTYTLDVSVSGPLNDNGIVIDFIMLAAIVKEVVLEDFDHCLLNNVLDNPTAERVALDIWARLTAAELSVAEITLWETGTSRVTLRP